MYRRGFLILNICMLLLVSGCISYYDIWVSEIEKSINRPSYSPDGKNIIFSVKGNIYLMDRYTKKIIKRLTDDCGYYPFYSSDGKKIVYLRAPDYERTNPWEINSRVTYGTHFSEIWIMDSDGNNKQKVLKTEAFCSNPFLSPDNLKIYYTRTVFALEQIRAKREEEYYSTTHDIFLININGSNEKRITNENYGVVINPIYMYDNKYIIYSAKKHMDISFNILKIDIALNEIGLLENIEDFNYGDICFYIIEKKKKLIFLKSEEPGSPYVNLYSYDINTYNKKVIAEHIQFWDGMHWGFDCIDMSISPDGQNILFLYRSYMGDIYPYNKLMEYTMGDKVIKEIKIDEQSLKEAEGL